MDIGKIFANNLNYWLKKTNTTQSELADSLKVSRAAVSKWCTGVGNPRMDKIDAICSYLRISRNDLLEEHRQHHYLDEKTLEIAQEIADNRELGVLFDAARTSAPEDLKTTHDMLLALKRKERGADEPC